MGETISVWEKGKIDLLNVQRVRKVSGRDLWVVFERIEAQAKLDTLKELKNRLGTDDNLEDVQLHLIKRIKKLKKMGLNGVEK